MLSHEQACNPDLESRQFQVSKQVQMYLLKENTVVTARKPKARGQDIRYEHSANHRG